jgi:hypothetical protein
MHSARGGGGGRGKRGGRVEERGCKGGGVKRERRVDWRRQWKRGKSGMRERDRVE